ncbi:MAG: HAMP domain-containing sensor histidine kinase [Capsulimonas sp.]|uniref:sensor histidine kinase n=1 Tax=Capsulimonas sp. TaxID=2494211 RepID=UPI003264C6F8
MTQVEAAQFIRRLKFPPQIESDFQQYYYSLIRIPIHIGLFIMMGVTAGFLVDALTHQVSFGKEVLCSSACLISLLLLVLSFHRKFVGHWQLLVVGTISVSTCLITIESYDNAKLYVAVYYALILFQALKLQIRWLALQILLINVSFYIFQHHRNSILDELQSVLLAFVIMSLPLFLAYRNERAQRSKFAEQLLQTQERHQEQQKLEQTEKMLHVLSQAIGSIAHDLGNPLTIVHGSAETLKYLIKEDALDKKTELEFLEMITDGVQMLNYLRLSLMEQTRVLEGKPILVELQETDVRHLIEAGARYQQPKFSGGRKIAMEGENLHLLVDTTRLITVFMNLIGNAFKYSDGEVKVTWRTDEGRVLVGVLDQGQKGRGISQAQAERLFVPFGRLETHAQVEGTGLGLLSARKIVEAHEGEAYIEGYHDGATDSPIFSTAQGSYPPVLQDGFCTALVTVFPLKTAPAS